MKDIINNMSDSDWIAFLAVLIAISALIISLYELLSNRPKLRVNIGNAITVNQNYIYVEVINYGRQPTTIDSVCFQKIGSKKKVWTHVVQSISTEQNKYLKPGEKARYMFNSSDKGEVGGKFFTLGDAVNNRVFRALVSDSWSGKTTAARLPNKKIEISVS